MAADKDAAAKNKEAIQAGIRAWREGTGSVFDLLTPDAKWTIVGNAPVSRTYASRQEFLDVVINPFNARLSRRLVPTVRGIYADGDMVIACSTQRRPPATGNRTETLTPGTCECATERSLR
jgi:ketosteroid isomerase-like protein